MPKPRVVAVVRHRDPIARVLELLEEDGFAVTTARSEIEALELVRPPVVVLLDNPAVERCPDVLCGWIRQDIRPVPPMVAILAGWDGSPQLDRCRECMAVFTPADPPERIVEDVRAASVWWPGDT